MNVYKKIIAQNKQATFNYFIEEKFEAGLILKGSEVQSLRQGKVSIVDAHASNEGNDIFLYNSYIAEYDKANRFNHAERRPRKLLLRTKEIKKIIGKIKIKGYTLIATSLYFNHKNIAKIELGLAKGKKLYDKRESIKEQNWKRDQLRFMRVKS